MGGGNRTRGKVPPDQQAGPDETGLSGKGPKAQPSPPRAERWDLGFEVGADRLNACSVLAHLASTSGSPAWWSGTSASTILHMIPS